MSLSKPKSLLECNTRADLARILGVEYKTLNYYAYGSGKRYKSFTIPKKMGGRREIMSPVKGLNNIQKKLSILLEDIYKPHTAAHGFISNRSILSNATPHINKKSVLNIDLQDFFPSITATRIIGLLKSKPFGLSNQVASAIAALTTVDDKMPQGAATSPVLSNMICYRLDRQLTKLSRAERVTYSRYADDITFSTTRASFSDMFIKVIIDDIIFLSDTLQEVIYMNNFDINVKKVRLSQGTKPKFVTGVKVNTKPNVRDSYLKDVRGMINAWEKYGLPEAQKRFNSNYAGNGKPFDQVVLGKLGHIKQIKGKNDLVYRKLHNRVMLQLGKYERILPLTGVEDLMNRIFVVKSGNSYGTGFILNDKWLITCAHVLKSDEVYFFNHNKSMLKEQYHKAIIDPQFVSEINEYDMAALQIPDGIANETNTLTLADQRYDVKLEDDALVLGYPQYFLGASPSATNIKVSKIQENKYGIKDAHVQETLISGNSGGPVVDGQGKLIGIVRTGAVDGVNAERYGSTFLPIQEMRKFLAKLH